MKALVILLIAIAAIASASQAGAATSTNAITLLSNQDTFAPVTTYGVDGYGVSSVALDTVNTDAVVGSDGYLCGNVQYRATQRWYTNGWPTVTLWTYRSTFGVHVCHNKVGYKTALYDEPMDSNLGWSWCGNIVRQWDMNPNNASAHSYTKGCFQLVFKIVTTKYPWAKMTIGGNGNLWARTTDVG